MIFVEKYSKNDDLEEIKDPKIISQVVQNLNLNDKSDDYAPIICGTVINGGFDRKLQMLRSDYYTMMSVCQSD